MRRGFGGRPYRRPFNYGRGRGRGYRPPFFNNAIEGEYGNHDEYDDSYQQLEHEFAEDEYNYPSAVNSLQYDYDSYHDYNDPHSTSDQQHYGYVHNEFDPNYQYFA